MKTPQATFSQWAAAIIAVICIVILTLMHFHAGISGVSDLSPDAIKATLALCSFFLFGSTAGSQAKDTAKAESTSKMIEALQNSAPIAPPAAQTIANEAGKA